MASDDVVVVAEFLVGVSNEVIEIQEVQDLAMEQEKEQEEEQLKEKEQGKEEDQEEVLMKSLEIISLQDHDYTVAIEATEVGKCSNTYISI